MITDSDSDDDEDIQKLNNVQEFDDLTVVLEELKKDEEVSKGKKKIKKKLDKNKLQLYIFVARCIAYPITEWDIVSVNDENLEALTLDEFLKIINNFETYLKSEKDLILGENYHHAMQYFYDQCLCSKFVKERVKFRSFSYANLKNIFLLGADYYLSKDLNVNFVRNKHITREEIENEKKKNAEVWLNFFDLTCEHKPKRTRTFSSITSHKDCLFNYCCKVLNVETYHHQLIYNSLQLDDDDEQIACIKRDLSNQKRMLTDSIRGQSTEKYTNPENAIKYAEIKILELNEILQSREDKEETDVETILNKFNVLKNIAHTSEADAIDSIASEVLKNVTYKVKVTVHEATDIQSLHDKEVFVVMGLSNEEEKFQTEHVDPKFTKWETSCEWTVNYPFTTLMLEVATDHTIPLHISNERELAKAHNKVYTTLKEQRKSYHLKSHDGKLIKMEVSVDYQSPECIKMAGLLETITEKHDCEKHGKWKVQFFLLAKISDYVTVLCQFKEGENSPRRVINLNGFTVDKSDYDNKGRGEPMAKNIFKLMKAGEEIYFAVNSVGLQRLWITRLYTATGQTYKPSALLKKMDSFSSDDASAVQEIKDLLEKESIDVNHEEMYELLQRSVIKYEINDPRIFQGTYSTDNEWLINDYCTRYGVRSFYQHLTILKLHLAQAEKGVLIDPTVLQASYNFLLSVFLHDSTDVAVSPMTYEEQDQFKAISSQMKQHLQNSIVNFRKMFPLGQPPGFLINTFNVYRQVIVGNIEETEAIDKQEFVRQEFSLSLKKAALKNYLTLSEQLKDKERVSTFDEKIEDLSNLAAQCIDESNVIRLYYSKMICYDKTFFPTFHQNFWLLYSVDLGSILAARPPDSFQCIKLFASVHQYCLDHESLSNSEFYDNIIELFRPIVNDYMENKAQLTETLLRVNLFNEQYTQEESDEREDSLCTKSARTLADNLSEMKDFIELLNCEEYSENLYRILNESKYMVMGMIIKRYVEDYEHHLKDNKLDFKYIVPQPCFVIINEICSLKEIMAKDLENLLPLFTFAENKMIETYIFRTALILDGVLKRLAFYDIGSCTARCAMIWKPKKDLASQYFQFIIGNVREFRHEISHEGFHVEFTNKLRDVTFLEHCKRINKWLNERKDIPLHQYQVHVLTDIIEALRDLYVKDGGSEKDLENEYFKEIDIRLKCEDAVIVMSQLEAPGGKTNKENPP